MTLQNCDLKKYCKITKVDIDNEKLKLRLYEVGFFVGARVMVLNKSCFKQTLLVKVLDSCFAIKSNMAESIEVEYE